jgi:hypothetical protein
MFILHISYFQISEKGRQRRITILCERKIDCVRNLNNPTDNFPKYHHCYGHTNDMEYNILGRYRHT